jgi:hypothetical protein
MNKILMSLALAGGLFLALPGCNDTVNNPPPQTVEHKTEVKVKADDDSGKKVTKEKTVTVDPVDGSKTKTETKTETKVDR